MSETLKIAAEIRPLLERRYLEHGWQGRLFGLERWLKAGLVRNPEHRLLNVIAVGNGKGHCANLAGLAGASCGLILVERQDSSGKIPSPNPYADIHLLLDAETPMLAARNIGAGLSQGDILLFIAGEGSPQPGFLEAYAEIFRKFPRTLACRGDIASAYLSEPAAVTGSFRLPSGIELWPLDLEENMAIDSKTFFELGGFDEAMPPGYAALDMSIRLFGRQPDFEAQRYAPGACLVWDDPDAAGLPFSDYLFLRQRSWLTLNETMKTYLALYGKFWLEHALKASGKLSHE